MCCEEGANDDLKNERHYFITRFIYYRATSKAGFAGRALPTRSLMYTLGLANALNLFSSLFFSMRDAISFFFASMKDVAFLPNPSTNGMSRWRFGSRTTNAKEMMAARKEKRRVHLFHCNCSCSSSFLVLDGFLDSTSPSSWSSMRVLLAAGAFFGDGEERISLI